MDYISFPKLGWKFPISPTLIEFELFGHPITIHWYGVLLALGFLLAIIYAFKRVKQFGIDPDRMIDVVLVSTLAAFVGARLYFVIFYDPGFYFSHPAEIFKVWKGGLAIYGGVIFAFLAGLIMCRVRKVNTPAMFDLASLGFLIGQSVGRWGNFFNQEAYGTNTNLPWGMSGSLIVSDSAFLGYDIDPNLPVHPTFLYESLWCLLGFILLHILSKKAYRFKGQIFSCYLIWYGVGRFAIESLRVDSLHFGLIRISQLVAILAVLTGLGLLLFLRKQEERLPKTLAPADGELLENTIEEEEEAAFVEDTNADGNPDGIPGIEEEVEDAEGVKPEEPKPDDESKSGDDPSEEENPSV